MSDPTSFDLEAVYDEQINPLVAKLIEICKANKLPMFATFAYARMPGDSAVHFCTTFIEHDERAIPELRRLLETLRGYTHPTLMAFTITSKEAP